MKCKICGSKEIKGDCQYINGDYYHNHCIEQLEQENKELHNKIDKIEEWLEYKAEALDRFDIPKRKETGAFWYTTRGEIDGLLEILKDSNVNE